MDISKAQVEPMVEMHRSHEALNQLVKLGTAAFHVLLPQARGTQGVQSLTKAINSTGEPWQKNLTFRNPVAAVKTSLDDFARLCLVQGMAGFDVFTEELVAEVCRCDPNSQSLALFTHAHSPSLGLISDCCAEHAADCCRRKLSMVKRIETLTTTLNIADPRIVGLLPVFHYFRRIRNCIAHDGGLSSNDLSTYSTSPVLTAAWHNLAADTRTGQIPSQISFVPGQRIVLRPSHAVLGATVCHRLANLLNEAILNRLGIDGLVRMACHHGLGIDHPPLPNNSKSPEALVAWLLGQRHKVKSPSSQAVSKKLKSLGLRVHCQSRYAALYDSLGKLRP